MDKAVSFWIITLCLGLVAWLFWDTNSMHINYDWHSYLVNPKTGHKTKPSELLDLGKVINYTENYIDRTNSIERLYDLEYNLNLENPFALEQSYSDKRELESSGWPVSNAIKCANELAWIKSKLSANQEYQLLNGRLGFELTQLMDSFGRPESGLFTGITTWLGSHKQCQKSTLDNGRIKFRYCQAKLRPKWWAKHESVLPKARIRMGFCIPETCDTRSFEDNKVQLEYLLKFDLPEFYNKNLEFDSMFCLPDERSPIRKLPLSGRIYLLLISVWLSLVITASILYELSRWRERSRQKSHTLKHDQSVNIVELEPSKLVSSIKAKSSSFQANFTHEVTSAHQPREELESIGFRFLESLSIHYSLKQFKSDVFRDRKRESFCRPRVDLSFLSFIKVIMAILVVLAHSCYLSSIYTRSSSNRIEMNVNDGARLVLSVSRCVDSFFMFFGLLTSYTLLRKFSAHQLASPFIWFNVNLGIFLRISPVFMLIYWYSRSVSPYTGSGPWWDYGIFRYSLKGNCFNEPWWKSVPYFGRSGSPPVASCVLPAWFIVSYSQLSLLMPLLTYLIHKLPNHSSRLILISYIALVSALQLIIKMRKQVSFREEAFTLYGGFLANLVEKFESTGTMATLGRAGCVAIGCYAGYLLRMYEINVIRNWPRWLANKLTLIIVIALHFIVTLLPIIGHRLLGSQRMVTMNEFIVSYSSITIIWPIINAILVMNFATLYNRIAPVRFLGHSFWHIFNKLGLCIFLVHWEVLFIGVTGYEQAPSFGFVTDIVKMWSFGLFFSILLAFAIHILFEAPLTTILKRLANSLQANAPSDESSANTDACKPAGSSLSPVVGPVLAHCTN